MKFRVRQLVFILFLFHLSGCEFLDAASYHFYDLLDKAKVLVGLEEDSHQDESELDEVVNDISEDELGENNEINEIEEDQLRDDDKRQDHISEVDENRKENPKNNLKSNQKPSKVDTNDQVKKSVQNSNKKNSIEDKKIPQNNNFVRKENNSNPKILDKENENRDKPTFTDKQEVKLSRDDISKKELPQDLSGQFYGKDIPLKPLYHFGGDVDQTFLDDKFYYVIELRRLCIYDYFLNEVNSYLLDEAPLEINSHIDQGNRYLLLKTLTKIIRLNISDGGEILSQDILSLNHKLTFGPYVHGLDNQSPHVHSLISVFPQNIEVFHIKNFNQLESKSFLPLTQVSDVYSFGDFYYLSRRGKLNVLDKNNFSILSEINLDADFKILGISSFKKDNFLVVGYKDSDEHKGWNSFRFLKLADQGRGITNLGKIIKFSEEVDKIILDLDQPYVYLIQKQKIQLFSLSDMNFSQYTNTGFDQIDFVNGSQSSLFISGGGKIGRLDYEVSKLNKTTPSNENEPVVFRWKSQKMKQLTSPVKDLVLVGRNQALIMSDLSSDGWSVSPVFKVNELSQTMKNPEILKLPLQNKYDFSFKEIADYGFFIYDSIKGRVYMVDSNLEKIESLSIASQKINYLDTYYDGVKDYIILSVDSNRSSKKEEDPVNTLVVYDVKSLKVVKKISSLDIKGLKGFKVIKSTKNIISACGNYGVCQTDFNGGFKNLKYENKISNSSKGKALDIMVSPQEDLIYVYYQREQGNFVSVLRNYQSGLREASEINLNSLSAGQFAGMSFSKGGEILIIPHDKGVHFYDMSDPQNPKLDFIWNVGKALSVDVTNRGKDICVALGNRGVECAVYLGN